MPVSKNQLRFGKNPRSQRDVIALVSAVQFGRVYQGFFVYPGGALEYFNQWESAKFDTFDE